MSSSRPLHWWQVERDPHEKVFELRNRLRGEIDARNARWRRYLSVLMNKGVAGFAPGQKISEEEAFRALVGGEKRLIINPIANGGDTLAARIASQRPRAQFLTNTTGPNGWEMKQKAMRLEMMVAGEWQRLKAYRRAIKLFYDGYSIGFGAFHGYADADRRLTIERVPPWEFFLDEAAAMVCDPRSLYRAMWVPAELLLARFPGEKNADAIDRAIGKGGFVDADTGMKVVTDLVEVIEAWHLPSSDETTDGRHIICCDGHTLTEPEEWVWKHRRFPFSFFRWQEPVLGWYPQGAVEQQEPVQQQQNKMLARLQDNLHLLANAITWVKKGTVNKRQLKNAPGVVAEYEGGEPPKTEWPTAISNEVYRLIWDLKDEVFRGLGVSQMSAQSVKPPGVESGKALLALRDTEQGRHALTNQSWDDLFVDLAELSVMVIRDIAKANKGSYAARYQRRDRRDGMLEPVDWTDIDLERDQFEIQVFPTAMLPYEPVGRYQIVESMVKSGFISPEMGLGLLQFPDLDQFESIETAQRADMEMVIGEILTKGNYIEPLPYQEMDICLPLAVSALLRARQQGAPEDRCKMLIDWIEAGMKIERDRAAGELELTQEEQGGGPGEPAAPAAPGGGPPAIPPASGLPPQPPLTAPPAGALPGPPGPAPMGV